MRHPGWMRFRVVLAEIWMRCRHPRTHDEYRVVSEWVGGQIWIEHPGGVDRYLRIVKRAEELARIAKGE
ncbi:hypothetical protein LCGC14_1043020 [marine sediment metagenome]|uniref:Uncharacterized protein n=1 Tax=marine sediment metagenome TaxID=412755 RepID=A0A0F9MVM3_9ZZZZ